MKKTLPVGLLQLLKRLWHHLGPRRRRQFVLLAVLMVISGFAEVISLGAVLPFLVILTAPDKLFKYPWLVNLAHSWGFETADQMVLPLTLAFAGAAVLSGAIRVLFIWASRRVAHASGSELSIEVYRRTLYQSYQVHVSRNSSQVISGITNKVGATIHVLNQLLSLLSSMVLLVTITAALIVIDPFVALASTLSFGGTYAIIGWLSRQRVRRNGIRIAREQIQVVKALQEGLGGIRDILLDGTQAVYCEAYRQADLPLQRSIGNNDFIGLCPRYAMEAAGTVLIAGLAYALSRQSSGIASAIPVLGALALGAQRLLPALQTIYGGWSSILGNQAALADTMELLDQPLPPELEQPSPEPLHFQDSIRMSEVRFRYSSDGPWILDGLNLTIRKGARVGIVGSTGSGKSTALDVLMGLLLPIEGELLVDGRPLRGNGIRAWQRSIAHVPQIIYLSDATIAENIAFGKRAVEIDMTQVRHAAVQAQIAEFIDGLPEGYDTVVGERGVRLSGGQRQRIGIARALYKQASLLVFDEATSALDNVTERSVMESIVRLNRNLTIVLIAHRLTTVRDCSTIVELQHGRVVAQGSYEQLLESSPSFRRLAQSASV